MRDKLLIFATALAGALAGANVQPVLTGAGKILFPENAAPASLSASSGALTAAAGGSNQNVTLTPSGTGNVILAGGGSGLVGVGTTSPLAMLDVAGLLRSTSNSPTPPSGKGLEMSFSTSTSSANLQAYDRGTSSYIQMSLNGNPLTLNSASLADVGVDNPSPSYPLDVTGDVNTSTAYRVGGAAGLSVTKTVRNSVGTGTCTFTFTGGIMTASTC